MRIGILILLWLFVMPMWALPNSSGQLVVIISDNWDAPAGRLYLLKRNEKGWQILAKNWLVSLGEKGLGWGRGIKNWQKSGPVKREGDGKAPAGLFALDKHLYGYSQTAPKTKFSYVQLTSSWIGVDDSKSQYYNQVFDKNTIKKRDWDSFEKMRRGDNLYKWLLIVKHNYPPVPGAGSCIFIHIWRDSGYATAGCTAMSEQNLLYLIAWLDPKKEPLLLQLPRAVYLKQRQSLGLPVLSIRLNRTDR